MKLPLPSLLPLAAIGFCAGAYLSAQTIPATPPVPTAPAPVPAPAPAPAAPAAPAGGAGIRLNFQGAALADVLNYLSESAGFVIVQEVAATGTVNLISRQDLTAEEAIDALNAVLVDKGLIALRTGKILKIVNRRDAPKRDLPVAMGSDPEKIPRKDDMVTQILPLRSGEAAKLIENLRPLLSDTATITANEASNSLIMTDTQVNVNRVARIIQAVDSSVSAISTIRVFPLTHADAKELAEVLTQLFSPDNAAGGAGGNSRGGRGGDRRYFGGYPGFPGAPGMPGMPGAAQSEAKAAASRVVAVADEQSNSIIVAAPDEAMTTIKEIILQVDTSITAVSETRLFRLQHADSVELAQTITSLYSDDSTTNTGTNGRNNNNGRSGRSGSSRGGSSRGGGFPFPSPFGMGGGGGGSSQSERALQAAKVVAVGDPRTNSLIVFASHQMMTDISELVGRLDESDSKRQRVYVHSLQHADAENVATILRNMFGDTTSQNTRGVNRLSDRVSTGVSSDAAENFSSGSNRGGGR